MSRFEFQDSNFLIWNFITCSNLCKNCSHRLIPDFLELLLLSMKRMLIKLLRLCLKRDLPFTVKESPSTPVTGASAEDANGCDGVSGGSRQGTHNAVVEHVGPLLDCYSPTEVVDPELTGRIVENNITLSAHECSHCEPVVVIDNSEQPEDFDDCFEDDFGEENFMDDPDSLTMHDQMSSTSSSSVQALSDVQENMSKIMSLFCLLMTLHRKFILPAKLLTLSMGLTWMMPCPSLNKSKSLTFLRKLFQKQEIIRKHYFLQWSL